jgi:hypothetical protein
MIDRRPIEPAAVLDAAQAVAALIALIEGSQILARAAQPGSWAPPGYDETDIRMLEWIGSHRRGRIAARDADLAA